MICLSGDPLNVYLLAELSAGYPLTIFLLEFCAAANLLDKSTGDPIKIPLVAFCRAAILRKMRAGCPLQEQLREVCTTANQLGMHWLGLRLGDFLWRFHHGDPLAICCSEPFMQTHFLRCIIDFCSSTMKLKEITRTHT